MILSKIVKCSKAPNVENMFFVIFSANSGLGWSLSNKGDEVSMCHFKQMCFWLNNICLEHGGTYNCFKWT